MRKLSFAIAIAALFATLTVAAPAGAALHGRKFQMPSGNIGCGFYAGGLRCDILSGLNPEPHRNCQGDWTGVYVDHDGTAGPVCAGDTVYDRHATVLEYGHKWSRKGIVCHSRESGLRCKNGRDHGFFLSRERWDTF